MVRKLLKVVLALAIATIPLSGVAQKIVGIAIAKSNDHVYTWFDDGVYTAGSSSDLEKYSHASPYKHGSPKEKNPPRIIAVSMAGDDHVYAWYRDQTFSTGIPSDLLAYSKTRNPVTLPANKHMKDIVGIAIAGSNNKVYVWFKDGTFWIGKPENFTVQGPFPFSLPNDPYHPGALLSVDDIVEMDMAKDDHVYTWYRNGMHSEGTTVHLANYHIGPYIKARVLYNFWQMKSAGRSKIKHPGAPVTASHTGDPDSYQSTGGPPYPASGPYSVMINPWEKDPMVAVSDKFMIVSGSGTLFFADRHGNALAGMSSAPITTSNFFSAFTNPAADNGIRIDRNVGFIGACNGPDLPPLTLRHDNTLRAGHCVSDFYDTRAYFDPKSGHFFIVAHAANAVQLDFTGNFCVQNAKCGKWNKPAGGLGSVLGTPPHPCGYFKTTAKGPYNLLFKPQDCLWSRFLFAFAVSKTDDPRDGFHQYVSTENIEADFPWMAVNGNRVVLSHHNPALEPPKYPFSTPIVEIFDLTALASGAKHPPFFRYYPEDLDGVTAALPPVHHGDTQGLTFLIAGDGQQVNTLTIFGVPDSADPWTAPTPIERTETLNYDPPAGFGAVYRNRKLYFASSKQEESSGNRARQSIRVTRIPITRNGNELLTSTSKSDGFLDQTFGNSEANPNDRFSYEQPSIDVNAAGAMLIGYHRNSWHGKEIFPEAAVTFWPAGAPQPHPSRLVKAGAARGFISYPTNDYTTTIVDPLDDNTFWVALPFMNKLGKAVTTISYIP